MESLSLEAAEITNDLEGLTLLALETHDEISALQVKNRKRSNQLRMSKLT